MNKSMLVGAVFGAVAATAGGAVAGYRYLGPHDETAKVVDVVALQKTLRTPRQVCHDEAVTRVAPPRDRERLAGTGIGALVGGLLGNRIGDGSGQVLATVAGAAAGGYAGNRIERRMQQGNTYTTTERRCVTVYDITREPAGYEVTYQLGGQRHRVRMAHDPGKTLPVRNGQVVTTT